MAAPVRPFKYIHNLVTAVAGLSRGCRIQESEFLRLAKRFLSREESRE
jgi:hypothetical protein